MRPKTSNFWKDGFLHDTYFGEINKNTSFQNNKPHGRGIRILIDGFIYIGYFENGGYGTGNYIQIDSDCGQFRVGVLVMEDERRRSRGTLYRVDGSEEEYDHGASDNDSDEESVGQV